MRPSAVRAHRAQACALPAADPDDQHFLDLAAQHQALLLSKDKAVLKQRKRLATYYGATVGRSPGVEARPCHCAAPQMRPCKTAPTAL